MLRVEDRIRRYEPFFNKWVLGRNAEVLGEGSSGSVFVVHNGQLEAALKVIPIPKDEKELAKLRDECNGNEELVRSRLREQLRLAQAEIAIMRNMNGESHIVYFEEHAIFDRQDTYGWDVLITMERLVRLEDFLKGDYRRYNYPQRDQAMCLRIWEHLLDGLCVCEKSNILHLDIKPGNIFYAPPTRDNFKLGDFGVSVRGEGGRRAELSEKMVVGTYEYMAPEVCNERGGDNRSDIYSLAMVIYRLLNNDRLPFLPAGGVVTKEDHEHALDLRLKEGRPVPRIRGVNPEVMDLLLRCLDPDPNRRFRTAEEVLDRLRMLRYSRGGRKKKSKLPLIISLVCMGLAGVLVALGIIATSSTDTEPPRPVETAYVPPATEAPTPSPEPVIETPTPTPEPTPTATAVPVPAAADTPEPVIETPTPAPTPTPTPRPMLAANAVVRFSNLPGGQAVGYVEAQVPVDARLELQLDGNDESGRIFRISEYNGERPADSLPDEGLCFIVPLDESDDKHSLRVRCYDAGGDVIYSYYTNYKWRNMGNNQWALMTIEAMEPVRVEGRSFEVIETGDGDLRVRGGQSYAYVGTAHPGKTVGIYLNNHEAGSAVVDGNGRFVISLAESRLADQVNCEIKISYPGAEVKDVVDRFSYDNVVSELQIQPITEDSTTLSGRTEGGAQLRLTAADNSSAETRAGADGSFSFNFGRALVELGLHTGDQLVLTATDSVGNTRSETIQVQDSLYGPLSLEIPGRVESGMLPWAGDEQDVLVIARGTAGFDVKAELLRGGKKVYDKSFTLDSSGELEFQLPSRELNDGDYTLRIYYADQPHRSGEIGFSVDHAVRIAALSGDVKDGRRAVSGQTLPGAYIELCSEQGQSLDVATTADGSGRFTLPHYTYGVGGYSLRVSRVTDSRSDVLGAVSFEVGARGELTAFLDPEPLRGILFRNPDDRNFEFYGKAEPGDELVVTLNGETWGGTADANGRWSVMLDAGSLPADTLCSLSVSYADGSGMQQFSVMYDTACALQLDPMYEDSTALSGRSEANVHILLLENGSVIAETTADENGSFSFESFRPGRGGMEVQAQDMAGNTARVPVNVQMADRAQITLSFRPRPNENGWVNAETLSIEGTAEPNSEVLGGFDGYPNVEYVSSVDASGRFILEIPRSDLPATMDTTNLCLRFAYADGMAAAMAGSVEIHWDTTPPALRVETEMVDANTTAISGSTEPGIRVSLSVNGGEPRYTVSDDRGGFSFTKLKLSQGDALAIRAVDPAGNVGEAPEILVQKALRTFAMDLTLDKKEYLPGENMHLTGWLLCGEGDANKLYLGVVGGKTNYQVQVPASALSAMNPNEMTALAAEQSVRAEVGYFVEMDIPLKQDAAAGQSCNIMAIVAGTANQIITDEDGDGGATFTVAERGAGDVVVSDHIDGFGMGFDDRQPLQAYSADKVLLTGWIYSDAPVDIARVLYAPVSNPEDRENLVIDAEVDSDQMPEAPEAMPEEQSICYLYRNVASDPECAGARAALGDIAPNSENGGFILWLDMPVDPGDYIITLQVMGDSGYEATNASVCIRIEGGSHSIDGLAAQTQNKWKPAPAETEAPAQ